MDEVLMIVFKLYLLFIIIITVIYQLMNHNCTYVQIAMYKKIVYVIYAYYTIYIMYCYNQEFDRRN